MRRFWFALLLALTLSACLPVAEEARDILDTSDGATLSYAEGGVAFDSAQSVALGVVLVITGTDLELLDVSEGIVCPLREPELIDCRLGDVDGVAFVGVSGLDVLASASYRRAGSNTIYVAYTR